MAKEKRNVIKSLTSKKVKTIILSFVIALVLASFVIYLVESIYPSPDWDDYCGDVRVPKMIVDREEVIVDTQTGCEESGGTWRNGWCDYQYECQQDYEKERETSIGLYCLLLELLLV